MHEWATTMILVFLGLGLVAVLLFVYAACFQSGNDAEHERMIDALSASQPNTTWPTSTHPTEHDDA